MGILEGGICVLIGLLAGRAWQRATDRRPRDPQPVCGCKHHFSFHDPETGECHGEVRGKPLKYDTFKEPTAWEMVQCGCRRYSGPEPMPTYYAPEIAP